MLKIEIASDPETATIRLCAEIDESHLAAIDAELQRYRPRLVFDLTEATLVDRAVVQFLAAREGEGVERPVTATNALGVWTSADCALVLIDFQKEMFQSIRSETGVDLVELHVRLLAKTAKAFNMPIVLSTVGVQAGFNGPTLPSILAELPGVSVIDRTSMNAFEDRAFSDAVKKTGRKRLIIAGLHTEICVTFASVQALMDGYDVMYVADAVGGRSQVAHTVMNGGATCPAS
ncbi:MAG TPA: isochorismatase family protein [Gemmatimonadaceae bacterium]